MRKHVVRGSERIRKKLSAFFSLYRFQGSCREHQVKPECTLTTAYEKDEIKKRLVISVQFNDENHWARKDWS